LIGSLVSTKLCVMAGTRQMAWMIHFCFEMLCFLYVAPQ
jgi:hypothetical protein